MNYPYLTVRVFAGLYLNKEIIFVKDEAELLDGSRTTVLWDKDPYKSEGEINSDCREFLRNVIKPYLKKLNFRGCLVYAKNDCDYLELDGSYDSSTQPPRMTMRLADGLYQTDFISGGGKLEVDFIPVAEDLEQ